MPVPPTPQFEERQYEFKCFKTSDLGVKDMMLKLKADNPDYIKTLDFTKDAVKVTLVCYPQWEIIKETIEKFMIVSFSVTLPKPPAGA